MVPSKGLSSVSSTRPTPLITTTITPKTQLSPQTQSPPADVVSTEDMQTSQMDPDELQLLFEVHTGKYMNIHEFELNV